MIWFASSKALFEFIIDLLKTQRDARLHPPPAVFIQEAKVIGSNLKRVYVDLVRIGLVRSKRHFSRDYLGRGWSYLREFEQRDRDHVRVSTRTVNALRARLRAVARLVPPPVRAEVEAVMADIDRDVRVADALGYRW